MSAWGGLEATFFVDHADQRAALARRFEDEIRERDHAAPVGSEGGPIVDLNDEGLKVFVHGRLRDVFDAEHSALVLAWFVRCAGFGHYATLTWELDNGPRYRYEWRNGDLVKLKGVLDG